MPACDWTALVVTCKTKDYADAIQAQLEMRQKLGELSKDLMILCIEDPQEGLGSGGATLNALLVVTELLSAKNNYTVVTSDVLKGAKILILHFGRYFPYNPLGRGFVSLALNPEVGESDCLMTNFDALFKTVSTNLAHNSPPGLWVCSSDMLISFPHNYAINWDSVNINDGAVCISVPSTKQYASYHGVYKIGADNKVEDLIFRGDDAQISACTLNSTDDLVPLTTGIVFFSTFATERLLTTHNTPPLDACTYMGIDSGMDPLCLSLFFDILLPLATDVNEKEFIKGQRSGAFGQEDKKPLGKDKQLMRNARSVLWKHLRDLPLTAVHIDVGSHCYLDMSEPPSKYCDVLLNQCPEISGFKPSKQVHSYVHSNSVIGDKVLLINSIIDSGVTVGSNTTIIHSHITENMIIGKNCYLCGIDKQSSFVVPNSNIPSNSSIIGTYVNLPTTARVFVSMHSQGKLLSDNDNVEDVTINSMGEIISTQSNVIKPEVEHAKLLPFSYRNVLAKASFDEHKSTLFMAKLVPMLHSNQAVNISDSMVLLKKHISKTEYEKWLSSVRCSFCEVLENVNHMKEFKYGMNMYFDVACKKVSEILMQNHDISLLPFFKMFTVNGEHGRVLELLDQIAIDSVSGNVGLKKRPDISARAFACIADVLGFMAGAKGGLRSGPASNKQWKQPLHYLEEGRIEEGVRALANIRKSWINHPDQLTRAARHYEGAEQILIRHAVMSVSSFVKLVPSVQAQSNTWYIAECPARIDLSGGWTDTPPVCYEHGGAVVNAAILLDGKRPIGARIRKLDTPVVLLTLLGQDDSSTQIIECTSKEQFLDYYQPQAPAALLKACFILAKIIDLESDVSLENHLKDEFGGGFELQTWSMLPRGSGLGTSSILAGAVMSVLYRAAGYSADADAIIHSVLLVEQMLTTGGGWQDQVGGCIGGVKIGRSEKILPLRVTVEMLVLTDEQAEKFNKHLKLVYTGKTRLARNLLQNVLRNWYARRTEILDICKGLKENAEDCAVAFNEGSIERVGKCVEAYWKQKKMMATGCEPEVCARMMEALRPYCYGQSLCGAGGGGFMYVLMKEEHPNDFIRDILKNIKGAQDAVVYNVEIDRLGMVCHKSPIS
uniref:L-fucose kinase-like n=1 Tax=Ciona intestinalis TaxID=7719 RepID=UPI000180B321|nr:L-fucose kinase-like [Ciona intestinalis]|eukprot:XP_002122353.1 L-fucose kinase-like [Ciona intestinalis]